MSSRTLFAVLIATFGLAATSIATADAAGLLTPSDHRLPPLDIGDHAVAVVVEDGYAITTIEQTFRNPHPREYEAVYSFPVPDGAAVSEFTYWIDGKPVTGEVMPRETARQTYETEKAAGHEAALAEQDDYKTFDITVWPVRPNQDVRTRLSYIQAAKIDTGIGRYIYPLEDGGVDEVRKAFWTSESEVKGRFSFDLLLRSAYPVDYVRLPDHPDATITRETDGIWRVHIDNGNTTTEEGTQQPQNIQSRRLDQDIVAYWRHAEGLPGRVDLVTHRADPTGRGTFMMTLTPGDDLKPLSSGADWSFVLDMSGSMQGKFPTLVEGVSKGLGKLRADDRFRIVLFNDGMVALHSGFVPATQDNVESALRTLRTVTPARGTNLFAGLEEGLSGADADRTSILILVTDGVANMGETDQRAFLELIQKRDIRLFTFVMGNSANRPLLWALAKESGGTTFSISNSDDIVGSILSAVSKVTHEAMRDIQISIDGVRTTDLTPSRLGSLYRGQQLIVFGHYWGDGPADVTLATRIAGRNQTFSTRFDFPATAGANPEIERLWAFSRIEELTFEQKAFGGNADRKQAVTDLATEFGLVTPETSMIVVRDSVFAAMNVERRNEQRIAIETQARTQRTAQAPQNRRADASSPMFSGKPQASYKGGGGAMDPLGLLFIVLMGLPLIRLFFGRVPVRDRSK